MSVVKLFSPQYGLADVIGKADDPTVASLARDAERRVDGLRDRIRQFVHQQQQTIALLTDAPEEVVFAEARTIGDAALTICEVAGAAGLGPAGEVARGMFAMTEALVSHGIWHSAALKLHVGALALFNSDAPPPPADCAQILKRLKAMRDWIGVPE